MNEKIAILNDLGDPICLDTPTDSAWPNYLEYGFTEADIPELIAVITDEELYENPEEKNGMWVHLHSWRTLGQLKAIEAIDPLIANFSFYSLVEDNSAFKELPEVLAMIGEPAIEAVANCLSDFSVSSMSRSIANDALGNIAKEHPDCRNKVLAKYKDYLSSPDCLATRLNGYVVAKLLDLKAVELLDDMRPLFEKDCVDINIAGDFDAIKSKLSYLNP